MDKEERVAGERHPDSDLGLGKKESGPGKEFWVNMELSEHT